MHMRMKPRAGTPAQRVGAHVMWHLQAAGGSFPSLGRLRSSLGSRPPSPVRPPHDWRSETPPSSRASPRPGHPFGVTVDSDHVFISKSAGDVFVPRLNSEGERVFAYDPRGSLVRTTSIATIPNSDMGLFSLGLDRNSKPTHRLYVADMNERILRLGLNQNPSPPDVFAQVRSTAERWGLADVDVG
jgi:hypothetical protein